MVTLSGTRSADAWKALWGKWGRGTGAAVESDKVHPLVCHLLDVAAVALALWDTALVPEQRRALAVGLGMTEDAAGLVAARRWVAFFSGIHDLGKASPAFQIQKPDCVPKLADLGLTMATGAPAGQRLRHGVVSAWALDPWLRERGVPGKMARRLATVVGGHHGVFPRGGEQQAAGDEQWQVGGPKWAAARAQLLKVLVELLGLDSGPVPSALGNPTALVLAGFVSVADWIGSDERTFEYEATFGGLGEKPADVAEYWRTAQARATVVERLGWATPPWQAEQPPFKALFEFEPSPMQIAVLERGRSLARGQALVVIEAPMGEGKTEAALSLLDEWGVARGLRGAYFALPTQATSNSLFRRTSTFLARRFPDQPVQLQLLHGHAALSAEFQGRVYEPRVAGVCDQDGEDRGAEEDDGAVVASAWFTARKRGLLAPWGVGTVDQALLAALESKHVFVRLFGLGHKTVVIDEVHAYDAYMSTLLERLLEWLGALGTSVALLSATLPSGRRAALARAYARGAGWVAPAVGSEAAYPCLSWVSRGGVGAQGLATSLGAKKVHVRWTVEADDHAGLADALADVLSDRGCVAVICNTVARAQRVFGVLRERFPGVADDGAPVVDLLHARFPFEERERRERRVLRRVGKPGGSVEGEAGTTTKVRRPDRAILVATQVIEQSLDLDFDLLVSDMAPVDLLLQRAGRLHRHARDGRPSKLRAQAQLWLRAPAVADGAPAFDPGTRAVYAEHVLLRTWVALGRRWAGDELVVRVPDHVAGLVEEVYAEGEASAPDDAQAALRGAWERTWRDLQREREREQQEAKLRRLSAPDTGGELAEFTRDPREEDSPELHRAFQALTRLAEESVAVVLLRKGEVAAAHGLDDARRLLRRSVNVSHNQVVRWLKERPAEEPASWRRSPLLRNARLVRLDADGQAAVGGGLRLRLDEDLGLVVERVDGAGGIPGGIEEGEDSGRFGVA